MPAKLNQSIMRGDDAALRVLPVSGDVASWRTQARDASGGLLFDLSGTGTPPAEIPIPGELTDGKPAGQYTYDIECEIDGETTTAQRGTLTLNADVTSDALPAEPVPLPHGYHVSEAQHAALTAANAASEGNPYATMADLASAGGGWSMCRIR